MNLDEIQQIFFQECEEGLAALETAFAAIQNGDRDGETINMVFRAVHSIKGGAGAFGHDALQSFSHHYETVLDKVRNHELELTPALITTIVTAFDMLADHVAAARGEADTPSDAAVLARLEAAAGGSGTHEAAAAAPAPAAADDLLADDFAVAPATPDGPDGFDELFADIGDAAPVASGASDDMDFDFDDMLEPAAAPAADTEAEVWTLHLRPGRNALANGREPLLLLRELAILNATVLAIDASALPALDALEVEGACFGWTITVPGTVEEATIWSVFDFADPGELELSRGAAPSASDLLPIVAVTAVKAPPAAPKPAEPPKAAPKPAAPPAAQEAPAVAPAAPAAPAQAPAAAAVPTPAPRSAAPAANQTIRVDLDKLDRLVNLVGELVITQAMLAQRLSEHGLPGISELTDLDHLTRELQDSTMAIRAQPMKTVFSRVPRIIRELETETGKRVRLDVEGEMTEVDKTVVERIGEPLTHLIRNAVDHGIESPEERVAAGKSPEGIVRLSAAHQSGRIVITISDDGRGIDRARVRAKAIERQIIAPDAVLNDEEIDNLIFAPGFSTAEKLSNISGRGVGMDVVRKNVQALGGRIGIVSKFGKGSSFSLSLPLTLAVLDGMIVTVGDQTFVVPLSHIVENLRPQGREVCSAGPGSTLLDVRGAYVPVHQVGEHLGIANAVADPANGVLIVVESDQGQAALLVDDIQDQRQVVVKSLEANYEAIHGLAGATILGDGRVALILDVDALISRWRREGRTATQPREIAA